MPDESENKTDPRFYAIRNAAYVDREEAGRLLAQAPALITVRNSIGETALHFLVIENDRLSVEWLLARGADVNTRNNFGETPLMEAAGIGYVEMCEFLLANGADMKAESEAGETAISEAAQSGKREVLEMLLSRLPADADINAYFRKTTADSVIEDGGVIADLLTSRGLRRGGNRPSQ